MNDRSLADLMSDLDAALANPQSRPLLVQDVLARIRLWDPPAVHQCSAALQLRSLGLAPIPSEGQVRAHG